MMEHESAKPGCKEKAAKLVSIARSAAKLDLAKFIVADAGSFDPAHPDRAEEFGIPASSLEKTEKPAGN